MKTKLKKYQTGGAKTKTAAQLKAEGIALKKKGEAMKAAGKAQAASKTTYKANITRPNDKTKSTSVAFNPKNNTLTTVNKSTYDPRKAKDVKVDKLTPTKSTYKVVPTGYTGSRNSSKSVYNPKNNTLTTTNYKNVDGKEVAQVKVTKYSGNTNTPVKAASKVVTTPVKKATTIVKTPVKEAVKTTTKTTTKAPVVKAVEPVEEIKPLEIRKAQTIEAATPEIVKATTPTPAKVEEKKTVAEKMKERKTERREKKIEKLKGKLGMAKKGGAVKKMQMGGSKRSTQTLKGGRTNLVKETINYGPGQRTVSLQRTSPYGSTITSLGNPLSQNNMMSANPADIKKMEATYNKQAAVNKKAADIAKATAKAKKMKTGGVTRKMQKGGSNVIQSMRKNILAKREGKLIDKGVANIKAGNVEKGQAQLKKSDDVGYKRRHVGDKYKTGGMVNPNSSVKKQVVPGSRGVKSGMNSKVTASKVAKGRVGGTSTAPKKAIPKAKIGGMMRMKKK
jgi:hypothetical protein